MTSGTLFLLVGNSGTGKDTLLSYIQAHWRNENRALIVPRRFITRPESPETEAFISITVDAFNDMQARGDFLLWWNSYDTLYGVARDVIEELKRGNLVIVNVSRQIIKNTLQEISSTKVIRVEVPIDVLAGRIARRGRETAEQIVTRLERARSTEALVDADFVVDNSGTIEEAGTTLLAYLEGFC